jgi:hypothetical protein
MSNDTKFAYVGESVEKERKKEEETVFIHLIEFCVRQRKWGERN